MLSYTEPAVSVEDANTYAAARSWSDWTGDEPAKIAALRRGQDWIAQTYNDRWAEEWENDDAPENVKYSIIIAARMELVKPGRLSKAKKRGIKSAGAGSARVEFFSDDGAQDVFADIDGLLSGLIVSRSGTVVGFAARA